MTMPLNDNHIHSLLVKALVEADNMSLELIAKEKTIIELKLQMEVLKLHNQEFRKTVADKTYRVNELEERIEELRAELQRRE